jgi:hypothetical protein
MDKAGIDPLNNNWSMVYDFTKNEAKPNWGFLPEDEVLPQLCWKLVSGLQ